MKLSELKTGERGIIVKVSGHGSFRKRITEMGFIKGKEVKVVLNAPLRDPIEYEIIGYKISLRRDEASEIEVISESEAKVPIHGPEENPPMNCREPDCSDTCGSSQRNAGTRSALPLSEIPTAARHRCSTSPPARTSGWAITAESP